MNSSEADNNNMPPEDFSSQEQQQSVVPETEQPEQLLKPSQELWQRLHTALAEQMLKVGPVDAEKENWQAVLTEQLTAIADLTVIGAQIMKKGAPMSLLDTAFFHDVHSGCMNRISGNTLLALDILEEGMPNPGDREAILSRVELIQLDLEKLLILLQGFKMEDGEFNITPESLDSLIKYLQKNIKFMAKNLDRRATEEMRLRKLSFLTDEEKMQASNEGNLVNLAKQKLTQNYPQIIFNMTIEEGLDTLEFRAENFLQLNSPTLIRIMDNISTDTLKAYLDKLELSFCWSNIDPKLIISVHLNRHGFYLMLEDEAGGFPVKGDEALVYSTFDQQPVKEYIPEKGKTKWKGTQEGTGEGLFTLAETINKKCVGASFRCYTTIDELGLPKGARTEIFFPLLSSDQAQSLNNTAT